MIIGVTHNDCEGAWTPENVALALGYLPDMARPPIVQINADEQESVAAAIMVLLGECMPEEAVAMT
jgi:signal recognition particle receptor subunit beta